MFFQYDLGEFLEPVQCKLQIYQGDDVQEEMLNAAPIMIQQEFINLMQQAGQIGTPVKIRLYRIEKIWDQFDSEWRELENSISFMNNAWRDVHREEEGDA